MRATLLAAQLNAALMASPQVSEAEIFRRVLEAHPDERLAQSILIDRDGRMVEFERMQAHPIQPLGEPRRRAKGNRPRAMIRAAWCGFKLRAATINSRPFGLFRRPRQGWPLLRRSNFTSPSGAARRW